MSMCLSTSSIHVRDASVCVCSINGNVLVIIPNQKTKKSGKLGDKKYNLFLTRKQNPGKIWIVEIIPSNEPLLNP